MGCTKTTLKAASFTTSDDLRKGARNYTFECVPSTSGKGLPEPDEKEYVQASVQVD